MNPAARAIATSMLKSGRYSRIERQGPNAWVVSKTGLRYATTNEDIERYS